VTDVSLVQFNTRLGSAELRRFPLKEKDTLRAWDAADEYLLNDLAERNCLHADSSILLINDQFGALAVSLSAYRPTVWTDSHLARLALEANCQANGLLENSVACVESTQVPEAKKPFDLVLIKVPKTLALLEYQLSALREICAPGAVIMGGGMVKAIHTSTLKLFEKYVGVTKSSLAKKKARLIFPQFEPEVLSPPILSPPTLSPPTLSPELLSNRVKKATSYLLENTEFTIHNHPNVFSRESLDIGTRFFLEHLPSSREAISIVDLGCGNGVVGLIAAVKNPQARLFFKDESYLALASARDTFTSAFGDSRSAEFEAADCLGSITPGSVDLVLNNPPFHQQNVVGEMVAWQMFQESFAALIKGGQLWVIGNRHLDYQNKLTRLFGHCELIAMNKKFMVLKATKRR